MKFPLLLLLVLAVGCATVAIPQQTAEQLDEAYDRDRYQAKIRHDPLTPQSISGFWRIARVSSVTMGSAGVFMSGGSTRDLDAIIDAVNEFTDIEAEFTGDVPYSHPALFDLPIVIPQSEPNEAELEQIVRYIKQGGFILDIDLGLENFREGMEKYGELVWGRDAWVERLPDDHPIFFSYFNIEGGLPAIALPTQPGAVGRDAAQPMRGLFVGDRLAGVAFRALATQELPGTTFTGTGSAQAPELDEEEIHARLARRSDPRLRQMLVNIVVFALTQEGSIAQQVVAEEGQADGN
tara:strand:- start:282 stop:1163 length:882 start_codon:yes stop_codon:yes gene_type:complete